MRVRERTNLLRVFPKTDYVFLFTRNPLKERKKKKKKTAFFFVSHASLARHQQPPHPIHPIHPDTRTYTRARAGLRALPAINAADTATLLESAADDDDDDDSGLRWGVAGVVAALPLFGFLAWLLPAMLPPPAAASPPGAALEVPGSNPSGFGESGAGGGAQKYLAFALLYFVAFASRGFNPSDAGVWGVTAACAAHLQLERMASAAAAAAAAARAGEMTAGAGVRGTLDVPVDARAADTGLVVSQRGRSEESKKGLASSAVLGGGEGERPEVDVAGAEEEGSGSEWRGGSDPWAGMVPKLPEVPRLPEVPELNAKELGRALVW